ncbi:MAG: sulfite exporter TauE/SafE family protein [Lentisphaeria bacterium]|nr:sulfite exporter TauE/SafE family protein [Lentisphaeria bacterium]NQZ66540.1 sulfite exporter TauE/SafE family protein [Lentisphaeria bacterium]
MSSLEIIKLISAGAGIGFFIGMTGVGGGVLVLPVLTRFFGIETTAAVGTGSLYAFLTKILAGIAHFKLKTIDYRTAGYFLLASIPVTILSAWYISSRSGDNKQFQENLSFWIAWVIIGCGVMMIWNFYKRFISKGKEDEAETTDDKSELPETKSRGHFIVGLLLAMTVGGIVGATSITGSLLLPLMIVFFRLPIKKAVGTTILIAGVLAMVTAAVYAIFSPGKNVLWQMAIIMSIGSIAGVWLGSKLTVKLPSKPLRAVVIIIVFVAGISMMK